jgi:hypothetical protein
MRAFSGTDVSANPSNSRCQSADTGRLTLAVHLLGSVTWLKAVEKMVLLTFLALTGQDAANMLLTRK